MAEKCANCGRADLMQADLANYQCLACGELTNMASHQHVRNDVPNVMTSPGGHPIIELSTGTRVANPFDFPQEGPVSVAPEPEVVPDPAPEQAPEVPVTPEPDPAPVEPAPVEPDPVPDPEPEPAEEVPPPDSSTLAPLDLSTLTPEQVTAIQAIANPPAA